MELTESCLCAEHATGERERDYRRIIIMFGNGEEKCLEKRWEVRFCSFCKRKWRTSNQSSRKLGKDLRIFFFLFFFQIIRLYFWIEMIELMDGETVNFSRKWLMSIISFLKLFRIIKIEFKSGNFFFSLLMEYKKEKNIFRNSGEFIDFIEGKGGNRNYLCSFPGLLCWTFKVDVVQLVVNFTTDLQSSVNFEIT